MDPTSSSREYEPLSYIRELEAMMQNAIQQQQYTITIAIAKLLYSILRIILGQQNPAHSSTAMDVDSNVLSELKALGQRVTEIITKMDIELIKQDKTLRAISKLRLQELLKIKSDFCLLLDDWDCDTTFKEAYTLLTKADDDIVAVLLPYLSSLSQKCKLLPTWFPNEALNEMKKRMNRPLIFVNLNRLLVRTTKSSDELMNQLLPILHRFGSFNRKRERYQSNAWNLYLIGLEAGHCGWYQLLYLIMKDLCRNVEKEANFYWLRSLGSLALAEWTLSQNQPGTDHYIQCLKELKVSLIDK
ncbi:hypothetical protein BDF20DRAFT_812735 [Mycotypha africana]|uniref:uncharacterized protein n=1 Tax=Mycotypha africana TaxID=64632 RepID=UPI002300F2F8|nr:uncharacterized protein BDF20DRAFT_812735 [Mycotypha africana]KAI8991462.1 hypothetical protein BDF20DRAFT_812735 [Mycotypha africana]